MFRVPFDRGELLFSLPAGWRGAVVESRTLPVIADVPGAVARALAEPVASPPARDLVRPGGTVCIVFTDATRASPDRMLLEPLLEELEAAGARPDSITLLCGVGMHRPSTREEKIAKLGPAIVERYRVVDHDARDAGGLVDLGTSAAGIPLVASRLAVEADLLIATGIVEPHQYAGYSGGRKTVAIGAGGEATIAATHGPRMVEDPGTRLGRIDGNPFHAAITEGARRAGLRFAINAVLDDRNRVVAVSAGEPEATFAALVAIARSMFEVPIPHQYDVAVAGVGYPKDVNLYQATRAASYLHFAPTPVVKPGGAYILPALCSEGAGAGAGEGRFLKVMQQAPDVGSILANARSHGYPAGGQRAFIMAQVLVDRDVIVVGARDPDLVRSAKFGTAPDMVAAFREVERRLPGPRDVLIVPHALLTLPIVETATRPFPPQVGGAGGDGPAKSTFR
jgi:lactate racemase